MDGHRPIGWKKNITVNKKAPAEAAKMLRRANKKFFQAIPAWNFFQSSSFTDIRRSASPFMVPFRSMKRVKKMPIELRDKNLHRCMLKSIEFLYLLCCIRHRRVICWSVNGFRSKLNLLPSLAKAFKHRLRAHVRNRFFSSSLVHVKKCAKNN